MLNTTRTFLADLKAMLARVAAALTDPDEQSRVTPAEGDTLRTLTRRAFAGVAAVAEQSASGGAEIPANLIALGEVAAAAEGELSDDEDTGLKLLFQGELVRVHVGIADSGGNGFRMLRVENGAIFG